MEEQYKYKIDKELLKQFFLTEGDPTKEQLREIKKVLNVVMVKHFQKYMNMADDLIQYALLAVLERRSKYDPAFSAYNYIYSIFRNEIGNNIVKLTRESSVEDMIIYKENIVESYTDEPLPPEVIRYKEYLTGEKPFTYLKVPKRDVLNLILFLKVHESHRQINVPGFVKDSKNVIDIMYKMLKDKFETHE